MTRIITIRAQPDYFDFVSLLLFVDVIVVDDNVNVVAVVLILVATNIAVSCGK